MPAGRDKHSSLTQWMPFDIVYADSVRNLHDRCGNSLPVEAGEAET